ncbi:MAG TPA: hypothetical protein VGI63_06255 [Verrucomicrobiae bacterium]|jgi:hypothetical protein
MKTRQLITLLAPSIICTVLAFFLLFESTKNKQVWQTSIQRQPAFEKFIDDVKSGRKQMTTGLWIDIVSAEHTSAESEGTYIGNNAQSLRNSGLWMLAMAVLHIWVVFSVKKDLQKQSGTTTR